MTHTIKNQDNWNAPAADLRLGPDDVHVWRASLNSSTSCIKGLLEILDTDEQSRADKYHFKRDRERFIVARGALRHILSRYLTIAPALIRFNYSPYGKPELAGEMNELSFNVSHSNELALYAVALGCDVGLDIEFIREDFAGMEIAERFFSAQEVAALRALPSDLQTLAFFNCWTRKEAYIKARGEGFSHPLKQFTVSCAPGGPAALLSAENDPHEFSRWRLHELRPGAGYVAALALRGTPGNLSLWQWTK
ncbi:MAG TPA: 4'-phosphopantetheinyl transferase superfamily protein [Pyrinomonadaceae bacterium]|nr:4'-phosphopantetheinyl transferase superfamily protein [Pyrinomonadaceae bacterium]